MTRKTVYADDVKAIIKKERQDCIEAGAIGAANTCGALLAAIDSLPAAEPDAGERVERPPMLYAQHGDAMHWWMYDQVAGMWVSNSTPSSRSSCNLCEVDRTASDEAALRLYDQDLAASRPATP